jgi:glucosylceramidase
MQDSVRHFLTAKDTPDRLSEKPPLTMGPAAESVLASVMIDPERRFQTIEGFGGAFTEAAAVTLRRLSPASQERILRAYFDPVEGHGYSLCRTHINSCDFSLGNYAFAEVPGDTELRHFSIDRDRTALLPMIQEALKLSGAGFKLFASPWSPPAWMKTNGMMNQGGKLDPEFRQAWADYYVRYIQEYEREGVAIWGVTVQNEPAATQTWDSCVYTAKEESDFVRDCLGPALQRAGLGHVKIIIWDHNRDLIVHRASVAYSDPIASKYIWGTGFHWYGQDKFENIQLHHDAWPDKKLIFTEGCQEGGPHQGSWALGERYARSMINDFNRWTVGWVDWNLVLDETGGPNHVNNLCSAPILADTANDLPLFQSSYYYIGHFARFVRPGSQRILCATTHESLEAGAFRNPDGGIAVIVLNRTDEERSFTLDCKDSAATSTLPAHSISTFLME